MAIFHPRLLIGLVLRLVMVAACVVPLVGPRKLAATVGLPPLPACPACPLPVAPVAPVGEEEESQRQEEAKERAANPRADRQPSRPRFSSDRHPVATYSAQAITTTRSSHSPPAPADPFRNGLGSPYRC
jgi:hypothetical protein